MLKLHALYRITESILSFLILRIFDKPVDQIMTTNSRAIIDVYMVLGAWYRGIRIICNNYISRDKCNINIIMSLKFCFQNVR